MANSLDLQLQREKIYRQKELFLLYKQSKLRLEDIADKLNIALETARCQIYSKRGLKLKTWIKYYILFTKSIKKSDLQNGCTSTAQ